MQIETMNIEQIEIHETRSQKAWRDIITGIAYWRIWLLLGWQDIKLRYRRSSLGPLWITLSMALTIYALGILYGHMWKNTTPDYMLYFASGMLIWTFIVTIVNESANMFLEGKNYLLQLHIPLSTFVMRILTRNFIIFLHNILAVVPVLIYFHSVIDWRTLLVFPALIFILIPAFSMSLLLGIIGLRFRDIGQLVTSLMNLAFFVTPVMWLPNNLPAKYHFVIDYNPFAQLIDLIRAPLMGQFPSLHAIKVVSALAIVAFVLMFWCLKKYRHRVVFWL